MTSLELDQIMTKWRRVIAAAPDDWARGFALSIQKNARRPDWRPSPKQAALMRTMVAELFEDSGEMVLIERG